MVRAAIAILLAGRFRRAMVTRIAHVSVDAVVQLRVFRARRSTRRIRIFAAGVVAGFAGIGEAILDGPRIGNTRTETIADFPAVFDALGAGLSGALRAISGQNTRAESIALTGEPALVTGILLAIRSAAHFACRARVRVGSEIKAMAGEASIIVGAWKAERRVEFARPVLVAIRAGDAIFFVRARRFITGTCIASVVAARSRLGDTRAVAIALITRFRTILACR